MPAQPPHHRPTRLSVALLVVFLTPLFTGACAPEPEIEVPEQHAAPLLPEPTGDPEHMDGIWWALCR
jgi:hypothetical protein